MFLQSMRRHQRNWMSAASHWWGGAKAVATKRVLVCDDDRALSALIGLVLRSSGFQVEVVNSGDEALRRAVAEPPDAIVLDLRMPGKDGRQVFRELREMGIQSPVLILSAYDARNAQQELGAQAYVNKPFEPERLVEAVQAMLQPAR
jgi:DNA-binding response OmpR family regulator